MNKLESIISAVIEKALVSDKALAGDDDVTASQSKGMLRDIIETRAICRTYSGGVHFGTIQDVEPAEHGMIIKLKEAARLWSWSGGGLSLSAVALNGMKGGRVNLSPDGIIISNVVEIIPIGEKFENSWRQYVED